MCYRKGSKEAQKLEHSEDGKKRQRGCYLSIAIIMKLAVKWQAKMETGLSSLLQLL